MAISEELLVKIGVDSKEATKSVKDMSVSLKDLNSNASNTSSTFDNMKKAFGSIGSSAIVLNQAIELVGKAYRSLAGPIQDSIAAFEIQEKAETNLANTLALVGDLTDATLKDFQAFAAQLQANSTIGDEYSLSLLSTAKAMGLSSDQAKSLTQASVDLAAATGKDVKTSFNQLLKSFGGFAGELAEAIPAVKELTAEQLKAGGAVDIVAGKFKGFGQAATKSLSGTKEQMKNTFGDLKETIGKLFVDIFNVPGGVEAAKKLFEEAIIAINATVRPLLMELKDQFISVFDGISKAVRAVNFDALAKGLEVIGPILVASLGTLAAINLAPIVVGVGLVAAKFIIIAASIATFMVAIDILVRNMDKLGQVGALFADVFLLALSKVREGIASLFFFIFNQISNAIQALATSFPQFSGAGAAAVGALTVATGALAEEISGAQKSTDNLMNSLAQNAEGLDLGFGKTLFDEGNKFIRNFTKGMRDSVGSAKEIAKALPQNQQKAPEGPAPSTATSPDLFKGFTEGANNIKQGMGMFSGTVAGGFTGGISAFAGGVTGMMAAADALADIIQKMIDWLPNFINKIAKIFTSLTELPQKLDEAIGNLINGILGFIKNFIPNLTKSIGEIIPTILDALFSGIWDSLGEMGENLGDQFMATMEKFPEQIGKTIEGAINIGLTNALNRTVATFPKIFKAFVKMIPILIKEIIKGVQNGVKGLINDLSKSIGGGKIFNIPSIEKEMKNLGKKIGKENAQLFRVLDLEAEAKAANLSKQLDPEKIGRSIWDSIKRAFMLARDFFNQLGSMIWMGFFQPVVDWFKKKGKEIWDGFILPVANWFGDRGTEIWEGFILPVATWFGDRGTEIWNGFLKPIGTWFGDRGTEIWNGFLKPIGDWFGQAGTKMWTSFTTGMETFRDSIGGVLSNVSNTFAKALEGLPAKLQSAFNALNPSNLMDKVFKIDYKGMGDIESKVLKLDVPWSKFAFGGKVGGALGKVVGDSPLNDTVPALLSVGEAVIPKSLMGNPTIGPLIEGILSGKITSLEDMGELILGPLKDGIRGIFDTPLQFNQGGLVGGFSTPPMAAMGGGRSTISNNFEFSINLKIDASAQSLDSAFIRNRLIPDIKKELKDSSLRGEFLMSNKGLR